MTAAETADMQRLLDEMKKEDAESAEQSARRDAEQVALLWSQLGVALIRATRRVTLR